MARNGLSDPDLCRAVEEMSRGLIDADLGGNLFKKRVALAGRGKRGGARVIVATRFAGRLFFLFGFEKSERSNISQAELRLFQEVARDLLGLTDTALDTALRCGELTEVCLEKAETRRAHSR